MRKLSLKNLTIDDLQWELDRARQDGKTRRKNAIMNEFERREVDEVV